MEDMPEVATKTQPRRKARAKVIDLKPTPNGFANMKLVMERALTGYREDLDAIDSFDVKQLRWTSRQGALSRREQEMIEQGLAAVRNGIQTSINSLEEGIAEAAKGSK